MNHVLVVGGGASGMVAAIAAAGSGAKVTLLEAKEQLGKKILVTGNGKCNFTNSFMDISCYRSHNNSLADQVLWAFNEEDTLEFFTSLGIVPVEKDGYYYPASGQASSITAVLSDQLKKMGVEICSHVRIKQIVKSGSGFQVVSEENRIFSGDKLILACGSPASQKGDFGMDGYTLAKSLGHHIYPPLPALVSLKGQEHFQEKWAGVRIRGSVTYDTHSACGEIQLTEAGISGIPVFQISRYVAQDFYEKNEKTISVMLDFFCDDSMEKLEDLFSSRINYCGDKKWEDFLVGWFPKKIIPVLLGRAGVPFGAIAKESKEEECHRIMDAIKHFSFTVTGTGGISQAQVCSGGVDTNEIQAATLESKKVKNLYFAGELIDVDGICGGYNLQWAWASGILAGRAAGEN